MLLAETQEPKRTSVISCGGVKVFVETCKGPGGGALQGPHEMAPTQPGKVTDPSEVNLNVRQPPGLLLEAEIVWPCKEVPL